jgi:hypothetical protein
MNQLFNRAMAVTSMALLSFPAAAQTDGGTPNPISQDTQAATAFDTSEGPGFLIPGLQVNADVEGGKTASLSLDHMSDLGGDRVGQLQLGATFTAPFDKDEGRGDLFNRQGVPSGFAAEGSFTVSLGPRVDTSSSPGPRPTRYWIIHGTVGVNVDNFKFRDPISFDRDNRWRTGVSGELGIGYMPNGRSFFAIGGSYARSYEAPDKRILCQTSTPAPFECIQDVFGPPERDNDASVFVLARHVRPFGARIPIAAELRVDYNISDDVVSVSAPLYFFLDSDNRYRAGVRFSWDSEDDDFGVGVFIGVPFSLFGL